MPEYWDAYLEEIGEQVRHKSIRELLKGFYKFLERVGKIKEG